ncbi:protein FANTASTIC FOUR 4-like [Andrographis paniculata]|uniref:protein FANTASTIC FOUR 4-like n=1 Tax=Andrographis paniculata TaxID=175694 RepID=UPI0021E8DDCE|nr:protein FANTASTIC FOUR 4-like [Andrographis paniculata]
MSTIVRQNFLTETTTLNLKLAADFDGDHSLEFGNWGFLRTDDNCPNSNNVKFLERRYSHPLDRKTTSFSAMSFDLCTENLGSETGSDVIADDPSIFSTSPPPSPPLSPPAPPCEDSSAGREPPNSRRLGGREFPPPLTTMSGSSSLQVRRRAAEGGRLIIEAVETPFRNSYLQAERSGGRLRLCFLTGADAAEPPCTASGDDEPEDDGVENGGETAAARQIEGSGIELESDKEEFEGEMNYDIAGICQFRAPRRCKEGGNGRHGLCCNWKPPLWVATS